jgi:hypothetical protein
MIQSTYVLKLDDFLDAVREAYRHDGRTKLTRIGYVVGGLALIAIVLSGEPSPSYWVIAVGLWLTWWGIQPPARRLKRYYQKSVTNEEVVVQIDETGITTTSPTARTALKWAAFELALETPRTFSLHASNLMYVFPKRAFNEASSEELRKLIAQNKVPTKPK